MSLRIVLLGTGAGKPMPWRSASATAVVREGRLLLLDCGEGAQVQLIRAGVRTGHLEAIFLTHLHGDHVNGLPGLLGSLALGGHDRKISVYGPKGVRRWLELLRSLKILFTTFEVEVHEVEEEGEVAYACGFRVVAARLAHRVPTFGYRLEEPTRPGRFAIERARALGVPPGPLYGRLQRGEPVALEDGRTVRPEEVVGPHRKGRIVAYCLDTAPCPEAVALSRDADVVIHDATYEAGEEAHAAERGHASAADAARTALEAGAKKLVLTHLSHKLGCLERFAEGARAIFPEVVVAKDLLELEIPLADEAPPAA